MSATFWIMRIGGMVLSATIFFGIIVRILFGNLGAPEWILATVFLIISAYGVLWCVESIRKYG